MRTREEVEERLADALTEFLLFFLDPRDSERKLAVLQELRDEENDDERQ